MIAAARTLAVTTWNNSGVPAVVAAPVVAAPVVAAPVAAARAVADRVPRPPA